MQLQEALGQFQTQLRADGRSRHTEAQYTRHISSLIAWLKHSRHSTDIREVTPGLVAEFTASDSVCLTSAGTRRKATSANALRTSIRCFFRWGHEAGLTPQNPARLLKRARCAPPPPRTLHQEEEARLIALLGDAEGTAASRDRMLILTLLRVGLRIGSAISLDVGDVDLQRCTLSIRRAKNDSPTLAIVPRALASELREFIGDRSDGPLFLAGTRRVSVRHCQRRISNWMKRAGIAGRSAHSCRHSFAASLLAKSNNLRLVQQALHHKSISSTVTYTSINSDRIRAALDS